MTGSRLAKLFHSSPGIKAQPWPLKSCGPQFQEFPSHQGWLVGLTQQRKRKSLHIMVKIVKMLASTMQLELHDSHHFGFVDHSLGRPLKRASCSHPCPAIGDPRNWGEGGGTECHSFFLRWLLKWERAAEFPGSSLFNAPSILAKPRGFKSIFLGPMDHETQRWPTSF